MQSQRNRKERQSKALREEAEAHQDERFARYLNTKKVTDEEELASSEEESVTNEEELVSNEEELVSNEEDEDAVQWGDMEGVEFIEAQRRVAVVNCNWDRVRAVDLYAILFHSLPLGGELLEVCVYKSEFGKKMIEHEKVHGPDLWVKPGDVDPTQQDPANGSEASQMVVERLPDEEEEEEDNNDDDDDGWVDDNAAMLEEQGEDGELFSSGKYRQYELNRMKYFYAIATFDSAATAGAVYSDLDGIDIEASGVVLDLRYVGDEEEFDSEELVGRADSIPANFRPLRGSLKNAALSQTHFRISWDQEDPSRHHSVLDSFDGDTAEDDLAAYLASASDDDQSEDAQQKKRSVRRKYAALLEEIGADPEDVDSAGVSSAEGSVESDEDDSLNRFSDVEISEEGEEDHVGEDEEMEATIDLDAESKATELQREAKRRRVLETGDLSQKAEAKYKLRRKEGKKMKREAMEEERQREKVEIAANKEKQKQKLKQLVGDDHYVKMTGKERRKAHAQAVKAKASSDRAAKKAMRAANQWGVGGAMEEHRAQKEGEAAASQIDGRFQSKLLSDPRYHLDVSQKDKRMASDVMDLAAKVTSAKRSRPKVPVSAPASSSVNESDGAVEYFLANPTKKRRVS